MSMKTAISIPDQIFESAESLARKLRVSRSELYTRAVRELLDRNQSERITERLNQIWDESAATGNTPAQVADRMAQKLIGRV